MTDRRLIVLGLDGLEPALFAPLLRAGLMPNLAGLLRRGRHGPLTPILADCAPACWASLVTGRWPDTHGVLAAREADTLNGGAKASDGASLQVPALWDWLAAAGIGSFRVGLPLNHPASGPGVCVSGAYPGAFGQGGRWDDLPPGTFSGLDADTLDLLDELRVHPDVVDGDTIGSLLPGLAAINLAADRRPAFIGVALARAFSLHNAATALLERQPAASGIIRYSLPAELCGKFLAYHPPRLPAVCDADFELYRHVIASAYRLTDMLLGRIVELAGPHAAMLMVSLHGYRLEPEFRANGRENHALQDIRPEGWWLLAGPGIAAVPASQQATVLDLAPTALAALGLAAPAEWPGRSLWPVAHDLRPCPAPPARYTPPAEPQAGTEDAQWLAQLAAMGLTDPLAERLAADQAAAVAEQEWNRYRILMQRGEVDAAFACLNALRRSGTMALRATLEQAGILGTLARWDEAARLLEPLLPVLEQADDAALRQAGLPIQLLSAERYRAGIQAILARARNDLAAARRHLEAVGDLPLAIPCLQKLREELQPSS